MFSNTATALQRSSTQQPRVPRRTAVRVQAEAVTVPETRKLLTSKGWGRAWIDGVTERVSRHQLTVSLDELTRTVRPSPLKHVALLPPVCVWSRCIYIWMLQIRAWHVNSLSVHRINVYQLIGRLMCVSSVLISSAGVWAKASYFQNNSDAGVLPRIHTLQFSHVLRKAVHSQNMVLSTWAWINIFIFLSYHFF